MKISAAEEAARAAEGVLNVSVQDHRTVGGVRHQRAAAGAQLEQAQVNQRQAHAGNQTGQNGVTGQQTGVFHAARARRVDDNDAEYQRAQRIHGQIAVNEAGGERHALVSRRRRDRRAGRLQQRGDAQYGQRHNLQRCQHVADGVEQAARIQGDADHQREVHRL